MSTTKPPLGNALHRAIEVYGGRVQGYVASCTRQAIEPDRQRAARLHAWARDGRRFLCTFDDVITGKLVMTPIEVRLLAERLDWSVLTGAGS